MELHGSQIALVSWEIRKWNCGKIDLATWQPVGDLAMILWKAIPGNYYLTTRLIEIVEVQEMELW